MAMDTQVPQLFSRVKVEIFRLLFGPGAGELHVRDLARRAGLNDATVRQELRRLIAMRLVEARVSGNRIYYRASPDHPLTPEIRNMVLKTTGLAEVLRRTLDKADIRTAFVFGSLAEGVEKPGSDVDLMIVGSITLRETSKLLSGVGSLLGREVNPHMLTPREFVRRRKAGDHFLTSVLRGKRVFVIGDERDLEAMGR
jgi:predicted nucleotidyltransferase